MNYKIGNKDIAYYGAKPYIDRECIALSGIFDMPSRKGTTEYNWGTSIEPLTDAEDIEFGGRDLSLKLIISAHDYLDKLEKLKSDCLVCSKLWTEFGQFDVIVKDKVSVEQYAEYNMAIATVNFYQDEYIKNIFAGRTSDATPAIDKYSLADFGIVIASKEGHRDLSPRIEVNTTLPYTVTTHRSARDLALHCLMKGSNLKDLYTKMMQFHALCMSAGTHTLHIDNTSYSIYFKDGFKAQAIHERMLEFDLRIRIIL